MYFTAFFNMVAEHPRSKGAMMLQKAVVMTPLVAAAVAAATGTRKTSALDQKLNLEPGMDAKFGHMMCLAGMTAMLLTLSWTFLKDMKFALRTTLNSKNEELFEGIMVANSETTFHKHRHCRGLQNATQSRIKNLPGCKFCFPDGMVIRGTRFTTEHNIGRLAGFGFAIRSFCSFILLLAAGILLYHGWSMSTQFGPKDFVMSDLAHLEQEPRSMKYTIVVEEKVTFQEDPKENALKDEQESVVSVGQIEEQEQVELMSVSMERRHGKAPIRYNNADVEIQEDEYYTIKNYNYMYKKIIEPYVKFIRKYIESLESGYGIEISEKFHKQVEFARMMFISLCTPAGMVAWIVLQYVCAVSKIKRNTKKMHGSRRSCYRRVRGCRVRLKMLFFVVLLYTNTQVAAGMEKALQEIAQQTAANTQQISALAQVMQQQAQAAATSSSTNDEMKELVKAAVQVATRTSTAVHSTADSISSLSTMHQETQQAFKEIQVHAEQTAAEQLKATKEIEEK